MADVKMQFQKKSRSGRVTKKQMEVLVSFVREHPALHSEKFLGPVGKVKSKDLWGQVAAIANQVGPSKTQEQWKQTWKDLKLKARKKNAERKRQRQSVGDEMEVSEFRDIDKKIISIIGEESLDESSTEKIAREIAKAGDLRPNSSTTETNLPVSVKVNEESGASGDGMEEKEPAEFMKFPLHASLQAQDITVSPLTSNHNTVESTITEHQRIPSPNIADYRNIFQDTTTALNGIYTAMSRMAGAMERIVAVLEQRYVN